MKEKTDLKYQCIYNEMKNKVKGNQLKIIFLLQ
jgi:hypothetical protein